MRLLHTSTFELEEVHENDIQPYAILSHRWEKDEVSYQEILSGIQPQVPKCRKLLDFCKQAAHDGYDYCVSCLSVYVNGRRTISLTLHLVD